MFTTIGNTSYISGDFGKYDGVINNNSVCYGRNSADNVKKYMKAGIQPGIVAPKLDKNKLDGDNFEKEIGKVEDFVKKLDENLAKIQGIEFYQQYMPGIIQDGKIDKMALMGAAYEELGKKEVSKSELEETIKKGLQNKDDISADALDLNKDGNIDIAEYSTSILLSDALSTDEKEVSVKNINGIVNNNGLAAILPYGKKSNTEIAAKTYAYLYDYYKLADAQKEFLSVSNNSQI